jgi:hypothetical protein
LSLSRLTFLQRVGRGRAAKVTVTGAERKRCPVRALENTQS